MKGATRLDVICNRHLEISIHAPVKGATKVAPDATAAMRISIHAPVKGATQMSHSTCYKKRYFNPRSREGSDAARLNK